MIEETKRNKQLYLDHIKGLSSKDLIIKYNLSYSRVWTIIKNYKKKYVKKDELKQL